MLAGAVRFEQKKINMKSNSKQQDTQDVKK